MHCWVLSGTVAATCDITWYCVPFIIPQPWLPVGHISNEPHELFGANLCRFSLKAPRSLAMVLLGFLAVMMTLSSFRSCFAISSPDQTRCFSPTRPAARYSNCTVAWVCTSEPRRSTVIAVAARTIASAAGREQGSLGSTETVTAVKASHWMIFYLVLPRKASFGKSLHL